MTITRELERLSSLAERLSEGTGELERLIEGIDRALGRLELGLDYFVQRPLDEHTSHDPGGKRVIEVGYLGYAKVSAHHHLVIKTVKVLESRLAASTEQPGSIAPLLAAPRRLRHAAVDLLPELVSGLAAQAEQMVAAMDRRQATASRLLSHLEAVTGPAEAGNAEDVPRERADAPRRTQLLGSTLPR